MAIPALNNLLCPDIIPVGGLDPKIYVVRASDVVAVPSCCCDGDPIAEPLLLKQGVFMAEYTLAAETIKVTSTKQTTADGPRWLTRFSGRRKLVDSLSRAEACKLTRGGYVVVYKDANGFPWLMGSIEAPMRFGGGLDWGKAPGDFNGLDIKFTGRLLAPPCPMSTLEQIPNVDENAVPIRGLNTVVQAPVLYKFGDEGSVLLANGLSSNTAAAFSTKLIFWHPLGGTRIPVVEITWQGGTGPVVPTYNWLYPFNPIHTPTYESRFADDPTQNRGLLVGYQAMENDMITDGYFDQMGLAQYFAGNQGGFIIRPIWQLEGTVTYQNMISTLTTVSLSRT